MKFPELDPNFIDFIAALNSAGVRYLLVGGYSVIFHGYLRSTMDMDIWVERKKENYEKIKKAFQIFKMPLFDMTEKNFLENDALDVFSFGRPPVCIDLVNKLKGVDFQEAWENRLSAGIQDINISIISKELLIQAKRAAGRHKDLDDIEHLE